MIIYLILALILLAIVGIIYARSQPKRSSLPPLSFEKQSRHLHAVGGPVRSSVPGKGSPRKPTWHVPTQTQDSGSDGTLNALLMYSLLDSNSHASEPAPSHDVSGHGGDFGGGGASGDVGGSDGHSSCASSAGCSSSSGCSGSSCGGSSGCGGGGGD